MEVQPHMTDSKAAIVPSPRSGASVTPVALPTPADGHAVETSDGGTPEHLLAAMMREPRSQARRIAALVGIDAGELAETATAAAPRPASDAGGYEREVDFTPPPPPTVRLANAAAHAEARFLGDRLTNTQHLLDARPRASARSRSARGATHV